ncbi:hypothetical protein LINPERPRIM_LOCUS22981 [Linum perenne]
MEDTFRSRVDKVFGGLPDAAPSINLPASTPTASLWSLTDDEVETIRWRKHDNSDDDEDDDMESLSNGLLAHQKPRATPEASFPHPIENDLADLDDDEVDEDDDEKKKKCGGDASLESKPDEFNEEEWEIKNSIGRDCTLDFEEEEDQYDKVAIGREKSGERVYMKDLLKNEYEIDTGPSSLSGKGFIEKDPRANHMAAKLRLKEDDEAAANKIDSLKVSDNGSLQQPISGQANTSQKDSNIKSILKRKDGQLEAPKKQSDDSKSNNKRVRFDPECKDGSEDQGEDTEMEADESSDDSLVYRLPESYPSGIPDYMKNPTKYTKYTFNDANVDEGSNRQAYMDFLKLIKKKSEPELENDLGGVLPKSLAFVPRKKDNDNTDSKKKNESASDRLGSSVPSVVIAAAADTDLEAGETCDMDEDEPETEGGTRNGSSGKPGRQYRMKAKLEGDDST